MKKFFLVAFSFLLTGVMQVIAQQDFDKVTVKSVMKKVANWQIDQLSTRVEEKDLDWTRAVLYIGMLDWAELVEKKENDDSYYQWLLHIGQRNHFQMGKWMYHADFIAVGQSFIRLYQKYGDKKMIAPVMARANWIVENPTETTLELNYDKLETLDRWSWCDALFMAPPVYAQLYLVTGDRKYLDFMDEEYKDTYDFLYDKSEELFYLDYRYFNKQEINGQKVFWGRGNGWVLVGLAKLLDILPKDEPLRSFYQELFIHLSARLGALQTADGYWHTSLLNPDAYPSPETSAIGLIVYALAYGVNKELLDKKIFLPIIKRGWDALIKAMEVNGKLGYVQPVGADPQKVTREMTEVYGVGAFLLSGCQIYKMAGN